MHLRSALILHLALVLAHAESQAQGNERRQQRRAERREWIQDSTRWDRVPRWSVGAQIGKGTNGPALRTDSMIEPEVRSRATYRLEATRRLRKSWIVGAHLENRTLRSAGLVNATRIGGHIAGMFGGGYDVYAADIFTAEHRVNTLGLMTGFHNAPFLRKRSKLGYTLSVAAGLGVHLATASYGVERDTEATVHFGYSQSGRKDVLDQWNGREEFARHSAMGLSALLDVRAELWLGPHVSLMLPMIGLTVPLLAPQFPGATDAPSGVVVQAYGLDLATTTFSTGITVHF